MIRNTFTIFVARIPSICQYCFISTSTPTGSALSSAVTDGRGKAVHILGYMPYGETLLDLSQWAMRRPESLQNS